MSNTWIMWTIVTAYIVFVFSKGVMKARKVGDADDWLVAGRSMGWFFLFCTMGATVIGGGASIGAIGRTYEWGVLMLVVSCGLYAHFIFAGLLVAPRFREAKLYTAAGYFGYRFGEGPRFVAFLLSLLFSVFIVAAQMAAFGSVVSAILPQFADVENVLRLAIIIGGSMVVIYSTAGGLLAVIHTDVYQFIVLLLGFFITLAFCVPDIFTSYDADTGQFIPTRFGAVDIVHAPAMSTRLRESDDPLAVYIRETTEKSIPEISGDERRPRAKMRQMVTVLNDALEDEALYAPERFENITLSDHTKELIAATENDDVTMDDIQRRNLALVQDAFAAEISPNRTISTDFFHPHGGKGWLFMITTFFAFMLGEAFGPAYVTRFCAGKNIRQTQVGIAGVGFFLALVFPAVLLFIALYARIHYPDILPQQALPMVVRQLNNPVIAGLIIGALLMAVMSSADSALNSATAIFVKDLFEHHLGWEDTGDGKLLRLARVCSAGVGGAAILVAVIHSDIIDLLLFTYHVWAPAIILPVCVGVLSRGHSKRQTRIVVITMVVTTICTLIYRMPLMLRNQLDIRVVSDNVYGFLEQFDPAVFGVLFSIVLFFAMTGISHALWGSPPDKTIHANKPVQT